MAKKADPLEPVPHKRRPKHEIVLRSQHGGPAQVGTADDPRDIDADGLLRLDADADAEMVINLLTLHGFAVVEP